MSALRLLSISHKTAPLEELERMAFSAAALDQLYRGFRRRRMEAVLISTCNRTELYWASRGPDEDAEIETMLFAACPPGHAPSRVHFVGKRGLAAAEHLFRVAAGLESLVVGEAEILGQVRNAVDLADQHNTSGFFVSGLFRAALRFGGKARQETGIGTGALSVASASVQLLIRVHPDLTRSTVLVIGAGMTGIKAARHLRAERVGRLVILNRTLAKAEEAALELECEAAPLETLPDWLIEADAVVAAAQVDSPLVTSELVREAGPLRRARPLVLLDLSLPRAIDPSCASLPRVVHHDLSGLEQIVAHNRARREREIPRVEALLQRELAVFESQARESTVRPVLAELRALAESIRSAEIERALADSEGVVNAELMERVTRRIVDRLLHGPSMALRRGDLALDGQHAHYFRLMFGLANGESGAGPHGPHGPRGPHGPHGPQGGPHGAH
jgi:glutamyl-tRNA reductase